MCRLCYVPQVREKWLAVLKPVIRFRPPENRGNFLFTTSNHEVVALTLSPKCCLVHKQIVSCYCQFTLYPACICEKEICSSSCSFLAVPSAIYVFLRSHGAVNECQILLICREKATEGHQMLEIVHGNEATTRSHV
jgi:hypothetical protein